MIEYFSTVKENGKSYAEEVARDLEKQGYEILKIEEGMVPRGEGSDGKPYYVPGYLITTDDGRPPLYKGYLFEESATTTVNENLQDPPGVTAGMPMPAGAGQDSAYPAPWLWG